MHTPTWEVLCCGVWVLESGVSGLLPPCVLAFSGSGTSGREGPVRGPVQQAAWSAEGCVAWQ